MTNQSQIDTFVEQAKARLQREYPGFLDSSADLQAEIPVWIDSAHRLQSLTRDLDRVRTLVPALEGVYEEAVRELGTLLQGTSE